MFEYDVFLSYSSKDKSIVHDLAERLKQDGLRVWVDKWEIRPGDLIPLKIQKGLEKSHILLMCMTPAYFESEWGRMEHYTLLFRDPTNTQRRLIPLLITDCIPPDTIAQFAYIDWRTRSDEAYDDIIDSCQEKEEVKRIEEKKAIRKREEQERKKRGEAEKFENKMKLSEIEVRKIIEEIEKTIIISPVLKSKILAEARAGNIEPKGLRELLEEAERKKREDKRKNKEEAEKKLKEEWKRKKKENEELERRNGSMEISKTFNSPSTDMEFVLIPSGKFMMGSPSDEQGRWDFEGPVHEVTIKNSFYLGKFPVTQNHWEKIMENNPSKFRDKDRPVENVSWNNAQEFIKKLNQIEGTDKYRLPSEAEWEYACRASTTTRYSFGDEESELGNYAWYFKNSGSETHPVGLKKPNNWGLYDMHGNVEEWCQDKFHSNYDGAPLYGNAWESGSSSDRVHRGGGWSISARHCRSKVRSWDDHDIRNSVLGFRVLRKL